MVDITKTLPRDNQDIRSPYYGIPTPTNIKNMEALANGGNDDLEEVGKPPADPTYTKRTSLAEYYNSILGNLQGSEMANPEKLTYEAIGYDMPTEVEIAQKISEYLRPNYDRAISSRRAQTTQNRAAIDVDAASRGMGSSTWLTDAKTRQMNAEASDIAGLESDYGASLAQNVYNMYNQHLGNKMNVDMFNRQNQLSVDQQNIANAMAAAQWLEDTAYSRALNAYDRKLKL